MRILVIKDLLFIFFSAGKQEEWELPASWGDSGSSKGGLISNLRSLILGMNGRNPFLVHPMLRELFLKRCKIYLTFCYELYLFNWMYCLTCYSYDVKNLYGILYAVVLRLSSPTLPFVNVLGFSLLKMGRRLQPLCQMMVAWITLRRM